MQGLRGVAVLLVVCYHAGLPVRGGFVGVDVFFVISGFVITALLLRELQQHGRIRFLLFYTRRVRRLLPAMALALICTLIASALIQSPLGAQQDTAVVGMGASLWLANAALYFITGGYFDNNADTIPLLHMWSLAVEEQFYIIFPALIAVGHIVALRLRRRGLSVVLLVTSVAVLISLIVSIGLSYQYGSALIPKPDQVAFYSAPTRAWEFGAGALVAMWSSQAPVVRPRFTRVLAMVGTIELLTASLLFSDMLVFPGLAALLPVTGTCLILVACRNSNGRLTALLSGKLLVLVGDVSYSWYLWHWPTIVFAGMLWTDSVEAKLAAAVISLPLAWASYRWVEQPLRIVSTRGPRHPTRKIVAVCVIVPVLLSTCLYEGARQSWGNLEISAMARQVRPLPLGYGAGCHTSVALPQRVLGACTFGGVGAAPSIILIGDSNAAQYAPAVVDAGARLGRKVVLATMPGCPFLDVGITDRGVADSSCVAAVEESTAWLAKQAPSVLVVAAANEAIGDANVTLTDLRSGAVASTPTAKQEVWADGLTRTLASLRGAGHTVLLVNVIPHFSRGAQNWWNPASCTMPLLTQSVARCGASMTAVNSDSQQARPLAAERDAASRSAASLLDLRPVLCPKGECATNMGNVWIYRDGLHLTNMESAQLATPFEIALRAATANGQ